MRPPTPAILESLLRGTLRDLQPAPLVRQALQRDGDTLRLGRSNWQLSDYEQIIVLGAGKATYGMAVGLERVLGSRITTGWINVPMIPKTPALRRITAHRATHPLPTKRNVAGTKRIHRLATEATSRDLIIALLSGGGSALLTLPHPAISLVDKQLTTKLLLRSGATIHELNTVRKHLSIIKGGWLAALCSPATAIILTISDVIGDDPSVIASGAFHPDTSTYHDAIAILERYHLWKKTPSAVRSLLHTGAAGNHPETPTIEHPCFRSCTTAVLANHATSAQALAKRARASGWRATIVSTALTGEARSVGPELVTYARTHRTSRSPHLFIWSGETTVTVTGDGHGGRNQELVLASLPHLASGEIIASLGTDGVDGVNPRPVAGAIGNVHLLKNATKTKDEIDHFLQKNNSYAFFKTYGGHIITGPTGTNVGDLVGVVIG